LLQGLFDMIAGIFDSITDIIDSILGGGETPPESPGETEQPQSEQPLPEESGAPGKDKDKDHPVKDE
jgi:hypothetical protein